MDGSGSVARGCAGRCGRGIAAAVLVAALAGCSGPAPERAAGRGGDRSRPSVLLIVLCSFRFDHMGAAGYPRPTTPFLDALAARAAFFENATSASSWTKPSAASLLTGLTPNVHGLTDFYSPREIKSGELQPKRVLADEIATIAELFRAAGYATGARINNYHVSATFNLTQGFDDATTESEDTRGLLDGFDRWLGSTAPDRPVFFMVFTRDAHVGYKPDHEYYARFDRSGAPEPPETYPGRFERLRARLAEERRSDGNLPAGLVRAWVDLYDAELAQLDAALSRVPELLERHGRGADTFVAVTADHGERLLEDGNSGHGGMLDQRVLRIPLILAGPGIEPGLRVPDVVRSIDLLPTLTELAGIEAPPRAQGVSLVPLLHEGGAAATELSAFSSFQDRGFAVRQGSFKLRLDEDGPPRLFDLDSDPGELRDVSASEPAAYTRLRDQLSRWLAEEQRLREGLPSSETRTLSAESVERLRALGYIE
jgi:arylsulfatase A-like enzyme